MGEKLTVSARVRSIDLAKSIAIACVVLIHVASGPLLWEAPNTGRWMQSLLWGSASRFAVPLFFLCSGALLLDEKRGADVRHIWTRSIPHILITLFFWASAYAFAPLLYHRSLCRETIAKALMDILCWRHEQHLYFLHIVVLVYAALPVTRAFLRRADEKTIRYALALWAFSGVLLPTARALGLLFWLDGIPVQWALSLTWSSIGCTTLGWRLRKKPLRAGTSIALVLLGFAICYVGTAVLSIRKGTLRAPKEINMLFGYRTTRSTKNQDTWQFAHHFFGRLWYKMGLLLLILSVAAMLPGLGKDADAVGTLGGIVCAVQLPAMLWAIIPTERALKRTFDKDGNRF